MKQLPNASGVQRQIRSVTKAVNKALKGVNRLAARSMARGDYDGAERHAGRGRELQSFLLRIDALSLAWKELQRGGQPEGKQPVTPDWQYYQPILKALESVGGASTRSALEPVIEKIMSAQLLPGDRVKMAGGRERWRVMIRRARKHLVSHGWIEKTSGITWTITEAGRKAAEKQMKPS